MLNETAGSWYQVCGRKVLEKLRMSINYEIELTAALENMIEPTKEMEAHRTQWKQYLARKNDADYNLHIWMLRKYKMTPVKRWKPDADEDPSTWGNAEYLGLQRRSPEYMPPAQPQCRVHFEPHAGRQASSSTADGDKQPVARASPQPQPQPQQEQAPQSPPLPLTPTMDSPDADEEKKEAERLNFLWLESKPMWKRHRRSIH